MINADKTATIEIATYIPRVARGMPCDQMRFDVTIPVEELDNKLVRRLRERQARLSGLKVTLIEPSEEYYENLAEKGEASGDADLKAEDKDQQKPSQTQ